MTDEGALQGEALLLNPPGSSCADPSCSPIGRSKNARLSTGYGVFSRKGRRGARQAPISVLHRANSRRWAPFSATLSFLGRQPGVAHGQPCAPVPDLVGSRFPSPYHFRARIQSFQAVAAPFPGDSVLPSATKHLGSKDRRSARRSPPGWRRENKHRTTMQLWQEICRATWELRNFSSRSSRQLQNRRNLAPPGAYALPFARRRPHLDGSLVRELRAELGQSSSTFPRIDS